MIKGDTIYFDNAATTKIRDEVVKAMHDGLQDHYGNPSSTYSVGRQSKGIVETCRKNIAAHFKVLPSEIVFTAGGTEADNLVLISAARDLEIKHFITSKIEHHAVLHTLLYIEKQYNAKVSYVNLCENGDIDFTHLEELLRINQKSLVSLMHINNEIGNILDIDKTSELCKKYKALFHTDSVQSVGHYRIDLSKTSIDFLAASAHKFHGPKGVGFAFLRQNSGIKPLIFGGEQERGYRAGTESIHNIIGLECALRMAYDNLDRETNYIKNLKSYFISELKRHIPKAIFNGNSGNLNKSTYTILNVSLPVASGKSELLLFKLDLNGIACSKGSACQSGSNKGSHVLEEILSSTQLQKPALRFSFSSYNTKKEVDEVINVLKNLLK